MILRAIALVLLSALPAMAEQICDPARGTPLSVTGVAANDTLNMRRLPSSSAALVARIKPGEAGVKATGEMAWASGQCTTTCSGAEGGLNDIGRSIAYSCKAKGQIWYQVRRATGAVGWASAKFLDLGEDQVVIQPPKPEIATQHIYGCGSTGPLVLSIYKTGDQATVKIDGISYHVLRYDVPLMRYGYAAGDGARLRGGTKLVEWRWPNGKKVTCTR